MVALPKKSTPRTGKHRAMLARVQLHYRAYLVHVDDEARLKAYASSLLKKRIPNP